MVFCSALAVLTTIGIVAALSFETVKFLDKVPLTEFLLGLNWEPQIPIREDQVAASGAFGWIPVLIGTFVVMVVALTIAVPTGLLAAIYLNEFGHRRFRAVAKPVLEILAGVPTVVYGFFAILVIAPAMRSFGAGLGIDVAPNSALAAGVVMGVMLIPFITSFSDDALSAVPQSLRDGALALGSTRSEAMTKVLFPAAIPGIVGGVLLAVSRAIGETMVVFLAAGGGGNQAQFTTSPFEDGTVITAAMAASLAPSDRIQAGIELKSIFFLGLLLFVITLTLNVIADRFVRRVRLVY